MGNLADIRPSGVRFSMGPRVSATQAMAGGVCRPAPKGIQLSRPPLKSGFVTIDTPGLGGLFREHVGTRLSEHAAARGRAIVNNFVRRTVENDFHGLFDFSVATLHPKIREEINDDHTYFELFAFSQGETLLEMPGLSDRELLYFNMRVNLERR